MAILNITTTHGAIPQQAQAALAAELGALTYAAEGFAGSRMASTITWTFFDERPRGAFQMAAGEQPAVLYYLQVTTLAARSIRQRSSSSATRSRGC